MDVQFGNPAALYLFAVIAIGSGIAGWAGIARRRAASRFASEQQRRHLLPRSTSLRHWASVTLVLASLILLTISLLDVRWGKVYREVPQKGIEVMFVLDVSRSMLAEDATPNRLSRAKQQIIDMVDEMSGDRIGLVSFAGESRQSVPLTSHYEDFRQTLESVGPHTVRSGGSRLGDALLAAGNGFLTKTNDHKAIVVFTDGEDQESDPVGVADMLFAEKGIRIFTVGLGDMDQGARVPESESEQGNYIRYKGQQVWSKLNGKVLQEIAEKTNGAYIPAGTRRVNMSDVYHGYVANVAEGEFETAKVNTYIARYQWFAVPALFVLLIEVWVSTRDSRAKVGKQQDSPSKLPSVEPVVVLTKQ